MTIRLKLQEVAGKGPGIHFTVIVIQRMRRRRANPAESFESPIPSSLQLPQITKDIHGRRICGPGLCQVNGKAINTNLSLLGDLCGHFLAREEVEKKERS